MTHTVEPGTDGGMNIIPILDYGYVKLVDFMGDDLAIARAARASYGKEDITGLDLEKDHKLVASLYRREHTSPFEMVEVKFEVKAPIFVFRQWHRHRTWSYNEISARYSELPDEFYVPEPQHIGHQMKHEKQMRDTSTPNDYAGVARREMIRANNHAYGSYKNLLANGVPRELARTVLPVSTYSRMVAKTNLHNLFRFLRLRLDEHAQYEIRVYAQAMHDLARQIVPVSFSEFDRQGLLRATIEEAARRHAAALGFASLDA